MSELKIGDMIRDNDPRMRGRTLTIRGFEETANSGPCVRCDSTRIRIDRIHTDGKPRRSGYDLVRSTEPADPHSGTLPLDGDGERSDRTHSRMELKP